MNDRLDIRVPWEGPVYAPVIAVQRPLAFALLRLSFSSTPPCSVPPTRRRSFQSREIASRTVVSVV